MKKVFLLFAVLAVLVTGAEYQAESKNTNTLCVNRDELEELIDSRKLQTLLQTFTADGKVHELMFTPLFNGELFTIEYEKTGKNKKYCVISITNNTNINEVSMDKLYDALERVRGHRA